MSEIHSENRNCSICGQSNDSIQYFGITDCNQLTCGKCAIKISMFSTICVDGDTDYTKCIFCKSDNKLKFITTGIDGKFPSESNGNSYIKDDEYGLIFEDVNAKQYFESLIAYNCTICYKKCGTKDNLLDHMNIHKKRYCELCLGFMKCLISEQPIYTSSDYYYHRNDKHPKCQFCNERFYDSTHLIKHVKEKHFLCDICSREDGFTAFNSHKELFQHYYKDHFVCEICRGENHMNVFDTEQNLKLHRVKVHTKTDLVHEGIVTLNFAGNNRRNYSSRRREEAAEQFSNEILQEGAQSSSSRQRAQENSDSTPLIICESEFPRLGDSSPRLGMVSRTQDENDARIAFASGGASANVNVHEETKKSDISGLGDKVGGNAWDSMANNLASSVRMNSGRICAEDFPSLGDLPPSLGAQSNYPNSSSTTSRAQRSPFVTNEVISNKEDFPALSDSSKPNKPNWPAQSHYKNVTKSQSAFVTKKESSKSNSGHSAAAVSFTTEADFPSLSANHKVTNNKPTKWGAKSGNSTPISVAVSRPKEHVPQVSISKPNYVPSNVPANSESLKGINYLPSAQAPVKNSLQFVSNTSDFQTLKTTTDSSNNDAKKSSAKSAPEFSLSKDFPSLASNAPSSKPAVSNWGTKSSNNAKKTNPPKPIETKPKPKIVHEAAKKPEHPSEPVELSKPYYIPSNVPANTEALKGINYLPSAQAPVKNSIQFVDDTSDFENLKINTSSNTIVNGGSNNKQSKKNKKANNFSIYSKDDFPDTLGNMINNRNGNGDASNVEVNNWTQNLSKKKESEECGNSDGSSENKLEKPLELTNEEDFPEIGRINQKSDSPKKKNSKRNQRKQQNKKPAEVKPLNEPEPENKPEVNLAEIGAKYGTGSMLINTPKIYSDPINCQQRNSLLYEGMLNCLGKKSAKLCLSAASRFKKGTCDVGELIDVLSRLPTPMLTEMVVLLPDIMLQQKLMQALMTSDKSRDWAKSACRELVNCKCCGQVLLMTEQSVHKCVIE